MRTGYACFYASGESIFEPWCKKMLRHSKACVYSQDTPPLCKWLQGSLTTLQQCYIRCIERDNWRRPTSVIPLHACMFKFAFWIVRWIAFSCVARILHFLFIQACLYRLIFSQSNSFGAFSDFCLDWPRYTEYVYRMADVGYCTADTVYRVTVVSTLLVRIQTTKLKLIQHNPKKEKNLNFFLNNLVLAVKNDRRFLHNFHHGQVFITLAWDAEICFCFLEVIGLNNSALSKYANILCDLVSRREIGYHICTCTCMYEY